MAASRISAASAQGATSVAITTPTAGDYIIVWAHRDGSTTAPTIAAGYTLIGAVSGSTNSMRVGWKLSNGTETTSGSWSAATSVVCEVWRGLDSRYPFGHWAGSTGSSATLSFPALTMWAQDNTSQVIACGAHRSATNVGTNAPSGMTVQSSAVDCAVFDTNGTVSSWTVQTAGVNASSGWCTFVIEVRVAPSAVAQPTIDYLVQAVTGSSTGGGHSVQPLYIQLPNPTKAGNCLTLAICHEGAPALTLAITDDQSSTWGAAAVTGVDGTNNYQVSVWVLPNIAAGIKLITVTLSDSLQGSTSMCAQMAEWHSIALTSPVDVSAGAQTTMPAPITPGAITTTQPNDLIWHVSFSESQFLNGAQPLYKRITSDPVNGLVLCGADLLDGAMAQYGIKATAGAFTPTMNTNNGSTGTGADQVVTAVVALKTSPGAGSPGSGKRIVHLQGCNFFRNNAATTIPLQFPSSGNLLVQTWLGFNHTAGAVRDLTAVADTAINTWSAAGAAVSNTSGKARIYYAGNAVTNPNLALTDTIDATQEQSESCLFDIAGMDPAPFDAYATTSGTQAVTGNLTTVTVTPTNSDGIVICKGGINLHTATFPIGAGFYGSSMYNGLADGDKNFYEDNPSAHYFNAANGAVQFVFTTQNNSGGVDTWVAAAAAFKAQRLVKPTIVRQAVKRASLY